MKANKRTERASIRMRKDILEIAEDLQREYGYSKADIFEMGVLLLDNNENTQLILQTEMYDELIDRFSKMEENVHKHCNSILDGIKKNITDLQNKKETAKTSLEEKEGTLSYSSQNLEDCVQVIIGMVQMRLDEKRFGKRAKTFEPLGSSYYEIQSERYHVPVNVILEELSKRGFDEDTLIDVGMNPRVKWRGYSVASKESFF